MKKYKHYYTTKQHGGFDCGITCALNILRYHGKEVSRNDFRKLLSDAQVRKGGVSMWELINSINDYGLEAQGVMCDWKFLTQVNSCPAIMVVEVASGLFHYIIAYEVDSTSIVVADPSIWAARVKKMSFHKFTKRYHWRGEAILIF